MYPTKFVLPAYLDPDNSVDLFDRSRKNEFGDTYCVSPAILPEQVDQQWEDYLVGLANDAIANGLTLEDANYRAVFLGDPIAQIATGILNGEGQEPV